MSIYSAVGYFSIFLSYPVNAGPIIVVAFTLGGKNGPYRHNGNTPGIFILFRSNLRFRNLSKVLIALCSFITKTCRIVYPYFKAYLINPFLFLIYTLIYLGVVSVAYSYPPGNIDISLPFSISVLKVLVSAPVIPQSLRCNPKNGVINAKLLPIMVALVSFSLG